MNQRKLSARVSVELSVNHDEKTKSPTELVSVGFPVRNGGRTLRNALDSVLCQDYKNLEIIISDNASTDDTASIALEYQQRDSRITYHRQPTFLSALENFRFVLEEARGEYFMWAAHDDRRSSDYISQLLNAMKLDPEPILTFGDLCITDSIEQEGRITPFDFDNTRLCSVKRMRKSAPVMYAHIYGLWKTDILRGVRFYPCTMVPDQPIMLAAAYLGKFKYVPGPKFIYVEIEKSAGERAAYQDGKSSFNKYGSMLELFVATYKSSAGVGGLLIGVIAFVFVMELHVRNLPGFFARKWRSVKI